MASRVAGLARVRAQLRRAGAGTAAAPDVLTSGDLSVDTTRHEVRREGELIALTPKEFAVLAVLIGQPGRVFSRADLLQEAFGERREGDAPLSFSAWERGLEGVEQRVDEELRTQESRCR